MNNPKQVDPLLIAQAERLKWVAKQFVEYIDSMAPILFLIDPRLKKQSEEMKEVIKSVIAAAEGRAG